MSNQFIAEALLFSACVDINAEWDSTNSITFLEILEKILKETPEEEIDSWEFKIGLNKGTLEEPELVNIIKEKFPTIYQKLVEK